MDAAEAAAARLDELDATEAFIGFEALRLLQRIIEKGFQPGDIGCALKLIANEQRAEAERDSILDRLDRPSAIQTPPRVGFFGNRRFSRSCDHWHDPRSGHD